MPLISNHKVFLPILLILVLGLLARLAMLPLMLYDFDEGIAGIYALQFVVKGQIPLHGIRTSLGFHNPPFFIWLISLPHLISQNPTVSVALLHLLNVAAAGGLAWQLQRAGLRAIAVAVALFATLAPGVLLLEHRMWGHAVIPALSTAIVSALWRLKHRPRSRLSSFAVPLLIAAAHQSHFSGGLILVSTALVAVAGQLKFHRAWLASGAAVALAMYLPWFIHDGKNNWTNLRTILSILGRGATESPNRSAFFHAIIFSLSDLGSVTAFSPHGYTRWLGSWIWVIPYKITGLVLLVSGIVAGLRRFTGGRGEGLCCSDRWLAMLALSWSLVPAITFGILRVQPVPGYWLPAFPGPWILAGMALQWSPPWRPALASALAGFMGIASIVYLVGYAAIMSRGDVRYQQHPAFRDQAAAIFYISDMTHGKPYYLRQELRSYASGIDYNLLYLLTWAEGNGTRLRPQAAPGPNHFEAIYHNSALPWPMDEAKARANYLFQRFGLVHVLMQQKNQ